MYYANNPVLLKISGWYGSDKGYNTAPKWQFYVQSLSRKERLIFTARNQNRM
jgi:hypothetical protein